MSSTTRTLKHWQDGFNLQSYSFCSRIFHLKWKHILAIIVQAGFNLILSFINALADAIRNNAGAIADAAINLVSAFIDALGTMADKFVEAGANAVKGFIDGLLQIGGIYDRVQNCLDKSSFTSESITVPQQQFTKMVGVSCREQLLIANQMIKEK